MLPLSFLLLLLHATHSNAARLRMLGRSSWSLSNLARRSQISGDFGVSAVSNTGDLNYLTNITINGQQKTVLIDTGSSDLWILGQVKGGQDTGQTADVKYAKGDVTGHVFTADIEFVDHKVSKQAYINVTGGDPPSGGDGLIGLGPFTSSSIHSKLPSSTGDPVLNRIFALNSSTPNFLSFTLSRTNDPTEPFPGELSVGEYLDGLEKIKSMPKNPVQVLETSQRGSQHWSLLVDSIIGPDGNTINYTSFVHGQTKAVGVIDSGFSLPQVPSVVSDAFYGRVQGASFQNTTVLGPAWVLPCEQELKASFVIGGVEYPIHPLDLSLSLPINGQIQCFGAFQPSTVAFGASGPQFDMILGMAFLRNTYTLIDFGDFVSVNTTDTEPPFVQLLSLTDTAEAHSDFVDIRLSGVDITSDPKYALLPETEGQHSPDLNQGSRLNLAKWKAQDQASKNVRKILIIVGSAVGGLLLLIFSALACVCLKRRRGQSRQSGGTLGEFHVPGSAYQPLETPAPNKHTSEHAAKGSFA